MNWDELTARLRERRKIAATEYSMTPVHGGDINRAWRLDLGGERFFVKTNRAALLPMFDAEMAGLDAIRGCGAIRAPAAIVTGRSGELAYIVMSHIELAGRPPAEALARQLAALHSCCAERYGFDIDNTIGSTPQHNRWSDDWVDFWREQRLGYQLELAAGNGCGAELIDTGTRLLARVGNFFETYSPRPSLLHGDLWSGNYAADADGEPVIFDPACYYGDHEADLAMMELFGSPGERFFAAYHEQFAIDDGYSRRRELYNLYHVLNHANLFGGGYADRALRTMRQLLAEF